MNYNIFFYIAGFLWAIELIPQITKIIKTKAVEDLSVLFPIICLIAYTSFFIGCLGFTNWALIYAHLFPFLTLSVLLILILKYKKKNIEKSVSSDVKKDIPILETDKNLCSFCERELVSESHRTKNGCVSCDVEYHDKLMSL